MNKKEMYTNRRCHDCLVSEGETHLYGCDMEKCPFCGRPLITCGCCYKHLGIDCSKGTWCYSNGLTEKQTDRWLSILNNRGRAPYIITPVHCARCLEPYPDFFFLEDKEWEQIVPVYLLEEVLCSECYQLIKKGYDVIP